eukprot:m.241329 g.241329  ORF g.241329 m.241329 type:complete len:76 (-) comp33771_c6_seq2:414-641(-)
MALYSTLGLLIELGFMVELALVVVVVAVIVSVVVAVVVVVVAFTCFGDLTSKPNTKATMFVNNRCSNNAYPDHHP